MKVFTTLLTLLIMLHTTMYAKNPKKQQCRNNTAKIEIHKEENYVIKKLKPSHQKRGHFEREVYWLKQLKNFDRVPKILDLDYEQKSITMTYVGKRLTKRNAPSDIYEQVDYILNQLKKYQCCHNDIKKEELLVKDGKLYIIDFQWAGRPEYKPKKRVGGHYKFPGDGYDDTYSIHKVLKKILGVERPGFSLDEYVQQKQK